MKKCQMKTVWLISLLILCSIYTQAQNIEVRGVVTDATGATIPGVNVNIKGTAIGTVTSTSGTYTLNVPNEQSVLIFSFVGYASQEIVVGNRRVIDVTFSDDGLELDEVVVIGYGSVKKKDLTGAITQVGEKEFQKGVATPDRMLLGKVAGVQVTPNSGSPGSGSRIRIRGSASLSANNDPLIIIDGVPLENSNIKGSPSLLSTLNPNDIESMSILKDASATAIYGSRASNGIIMITTKQAKLGQPIKVEFNTQFSASQLIKKMDILSPDQIRDVVTNHPKSNDDYRAMLGNSNTDWQNEVYQTAFGTDNSLSISGATSTMPYRVSVGYLNENGILKSGNMERITTNVNLSPRYFDNKLRFDISLKGSAVNSKFANNGAIEGAMGFDPTQPVRADGFDKYGGYFTWLLPDGNVNTLAFSNPVAMLDTYNDKSQTLRGIASLQVDYKMHFLPELRANLNLSYDYTQGYGNESYPAWASYGVTRGGKTQDKGGFNTNKLLEFYLNYAKDITSIKSFVDVTAGYTYQDWLSHTEHYQDYTADGKPYGTPVNYPYDESQHTLISFFGRLNYTLMGKYLLTASIRRDGSSRFSPNNRWGNFPSVALAWHISEEGFLKNSNIVSELKIRGGYGETGQQDIGQNYGYIPYYRQSTTKTQYQFGNQYYYMNRPEAYDQDLKWESTATYNIALDYGFWNNRITGSIDFYKKETKDMLNRVQVAAGSNFNDMLLTNIGAMENKGVELNINATPVQNKDWTWDFGFNIAYNKSEITKLTAFNDPEYLGVGAAYTDYGNALQIQTVGFPLNSFFLYNQIYDEAGNPLEGVYADFNGDGLINENDKERLKSSEPTIIGGFSTSLSYRKWTLSTSIRGSYDNYVYNGINATYGTYGTLFSNSNTIVNVPADVLKTNFYYQQQYSDYYLENASFIKMDNISLSYDFGRVFNNSVGIRATFGVQNVFTITNYSGTDPEIPNGVDRKFYPRPRTYALGFNVTF